MGNKKSVPARDDPYAVLEVDRSASQKEIRRKYTEMLLKYHPTRNKSSSDSKVIEIRDAYRAIVENNEPPAPEPVQINLDAYTESYIKGLGAEFYGTVSALFESLCEGEPKANYPRFGDANSKNFGSFYRFFRKFRTQRLLSGNKTENKFLQKEFSKKIKDIVEIIATHDERLKTVIHEKPISENYQVKHKKRLKKKRDTEFCCDACKKGFRSKNQMLVHLKSRKHMEKIMLTQEDYRSYIEKEIANVSALEECSQQKSIPGSPSSEREDQDSKAVEDNEKMLQDLYKKIEKTKLQSEDDIADAPHPEAHEERPCNKPQRTVAKKSKKGKVIQRKTPKKKNENFVPNESVHFLTCMRCKKKFESRNRLFVHLREEGHSGK